MSLIKLFTRFGILVILYVHVVCSFETFQLICENPTTIPTNCTIVCTNITENATCNANSCNSTVCQNISVCSNETSTDSCDGSIEWTESRSTKYWKEYVAILTGVYTNPTICSYHGNSPVITTSCLYSIDSGQVKKCSIDNGGCGICKAAGFPSGNLWLSASVIVLELNPVEECACGDDQCQCSEESCGSSSRRW